ncbi:hypothetical protein NO1_0578 [Candidatus Termititenax aidoneus]|uniref:Radical SAM core domain-containing protein n=1 Tax=Termititenax aidoneus TaxID=2218524 RepID=A0A388T952_TERA1|nr:hypothetical protein NO1_0578 [Candidatus Termititenax aidoneus]
MIDVFCGEFLINVTPLEMSGNSCSHNCAYCFANIERGCRVSEISREIKFLTGKSSANNLATLLYHKGYPICFSNRTDPFSESNIKDTRVLAKILKQKENGLFIQTKLGKDEYIEEFLETMSGKKNIVFYITITTPNDDISKIIEPNAPLPSRRKAWAIKLSKMGYPVIVAFNPFVEGWTNLNENLKECKEYQRAGINHFIYQNLKLNPMKVKSFSPGRRKQFEKTGINLNLYCNKNSTKDRQKYAQQAVINARKAGCEALMFGMPFRNDFFDILVSTYGKDKVFPSNYFFYNWLIKNKKAGDIVIREEYVNVLAPYLGDLIDTPIKAMPTYILRTARQVWKGNERVQRMTTYRELLGVIFDDKRISACPKRNFLISENDKGSAVFNGEIKP